MLDQTSPFVSLPKLSSVNTMEQGVYECLKKAIIAGKLAPGLKLVTSKIADELGVSRMPVREAVRRLAVEGFVTNVPHRGAIVAELSSQDVEEIYNIRMVLEGYAMKLSVARVTADEIASLESLQSTMKEGIGTNDLDQVQAVDDEFHRILFCICGSERLTQLLTNMWDQCIFYRSVAALLRKDLSLSIRHHEELIAALCSTDTERAVKAIQMHTAVARDTLVEYLRRREANIL